MEKACYFCHLRTVENLIQKFNVSNDKADEFRFQADQFFQHNWKLNNPLITTHLHRIARQFIDTDDLYAKEKKQANELLFDNYDYWSKLVKKSSDPFETAAKLAVIGNIIDYGAHSVPENLVEFILQKLNENFATFEIAALKSAVRKSRRIMYLGDNAGEIVFDKLFIETLNHPELTFVTRDKEVLNDVTMKDAASIGLDKITKVISNGYDAPSTLLEKCSSEFINQFDNADLILSKGQGNLEGLISLNDNRIFFMLMVKCEVIAEKMKVPKMSMVIKQQKNEL